jgi:hypothetical protein
VQKIVVGKGTGLLAILVITASISPVFALTELERVSLSDPRLEQWGAGGIIIKNINVNQQIQISADVKNNQEKSQDFLYLVQIKDDRDYVISFGWISGQLTPDQKFSPSLSWTPTIPGEYIAEIFVWEGIINHKALSEFTTLQINVS